MRDTLRITREVRETELLVGNHAMVAAEDAAIARLEARIAQLEAAAQRFATRLRASADRESPPGIERD